MFGSSLRVLSTWVLVLWYVGTTALPAPLAKQSLPSQPQPWGMPSPKPDLLFGPFKMRAGTEYANLRFTDLISDRCSADPRSGRRTATIVRPHVGFMSAWWQCVRVRIRHMGRFEVCCVIRRFMAANVGGMIRPGVHEARGPLQCKWRIWSREGGDVSRLGTPAASKVRSLLEVLEP